MSIERFFNGSEQFNSFFKELEVRAESVDLNTSEKAKRVIAKRRKNRELTSKDLTHIRMFPVLVKEIDGYNEESFIAIMESEEGPRFLGYISLGYKGFEDKEASKWTLLLSEDEIVFDLESETFIEDPYQSNS